jgi:hypothetical protein
VGCIYIPDCIPVIISNAVRRNLLISGAQVSTCTDCLDTNVTGKSRSAIRNEYGKTKREIPNKFLNNFAISIATTRHLQPSRRSCCRNFV